MPLANRRLDCSWLWSESVWFMPISLTSSSTTTTRHGPHRGQFKLTILFLICFVNMYLVVGFVFCFFCRLWPSEEGKPTWESSWLPMVYFLASSESGGSSTMEWTTRLDERAQSSCTRYKLLGLDGTSQVIGSYQTIFGSIFWWKSRKVCVYGVEEFITHLRDSLHRIGGWVFGHGFIQKTDWCAWRKKSYLLPGRSDTRAKPSRIRNAYRDLSFVWSSYWVISWVYCKVFPNYRRVQGWNILAKNRTWYIQFGDRTREWYFVTYTPPPAQVNHKQHQSKVGGGQGPDVGCLFLMESHHIRYSYGHSISVGGISSNSSG